MLRDCSKVRAARAARLIFVLTRPIKFLINGVVVAVLLSMLKLPIDRYHAAAILELKRGWTGINIGHAPFRMLNLF